MKEQLKNRTKKFARKCVKLTQQLQNSYLSNHIKGQLICCSTSVAANYSATSVAQSKPSFIVKLSIVIEKEIILPFLKEAEELTAIFIASRKTANR